ncbi:MAG: cation:proton antiporter [Planctomycetota bacterium]
MLPLLASQSGSTASTLALVVGVGLLAQWVAARLRLPALVLLLLSGLALGPLTGILDPDRDFGPSLKDAVSLAVGLVLFEGGLALRWQDARRAGPVLWRLIICGLVLGALMVGFLGRAIAGLDPTTAAILGAILVVTGPTVVLPLLRQARVGHRITTLLKWEGIVNDPLGALLAVFVFQIATAEQDMTLLVPELALRGLLAGAIGISAGVLLGEGLRRGLLPEHLKIPTMLTGAILIHVGGEAVGEENGLLAVTLAGLVLANIGGSSIADIRHFKEQVNVLLVSFLFVVLSARVRVEDLEAMLGWPLVLVAAVVLVVRPLVILAATIKSSLPMKERILLAWIAPRGVVAAAVAGAFATRLEDAGFADAGLLVPIVFGVVIVTVAQGATLAPLARRFGLSAKEGKGVLMIGASRWVLELAQAIEKAGAEVLLADTRYQRVSRARRRGFEAFFGDVLSEEAEFELQVERVSWVFAATDDDAYNSLICLHYGRELGKDRVLQLSPESGSERRDSTHALMAPSPFGERGTYGNFSQAYWTGQPFKVTRLTEEHGLPELQERCPNALLLFSVLDERLQPYKPDTTLPPGAFVIYLESVKAEEVASEPAN